MAAASLGADSVISAFVDIASPDASLDPLEVRYLLSSIGIRDDKRFIALLPSPLTLAEAVAESGKSASGRAELRALTLGGAVWDAFRENANAGTFWGFNWENSGKI